MESDDAFRLQSSNCIRHERKRDRHEIVRHANSSENVSGLSNIMAKVFLQRSADDQRRKKNSQLETALRMRRALTEADADLHEFITVKIQGLIRDM